MRRALLSTSRYRQPSLNFQDAQKIVEKSHQVSRVNTLVAFSNGFPFLSTKAYYISYQARLFALSPILLCTFFWLNQQVHVCSLIRFTMCTHPRFLFIRKQSGLAFKFHSGNYLRHALTSRIKQRRRFFALLNGL